jgi:hypothetical protein
LGAVSIAPLAAVRTWVVPAPATSMGVRVAYQVRGRSRALLEAATSSGPVYAVHVAVGDRFETQSQSAARFVLTTSSGPRFTVEEDA